MTNSPDKKIPIAVAILCIFMLLTGNLWGVIETSEARYAEISREMYRSGDWLHPSLLNIHHYHKPPVTYWVTATAFSIFGVNAFAARFFLVLSFGVQVLLLFRIARLLFKNKEIAGYCALVYATLPLTLISVRGLTTDSYLTTFVLLSLFYGLKFIESKKVLFLYGMAFALGVGFLVKGPVIFIVPVLAIASMWNHARIKINEGTIALLIFVTVGFSWFAFLVAEDSRFADYFFFRHFVDRLANAEVFARKEPWYYYLPIIPLVTLPWIIIFIGGILAKKATGDDRRMINRLLLWWILLPLIVFSISSSKLVLYILPLSIGFSLAAGYFLAGGISKILFKFFLAIPIIINLCLISIPIFFSRFNFNNTLYISSSFTLVACLVVWFLILQRELAVLLASTLFTINLILFSSQFFSLNANEVNSLATVTSFIKQQGLHDRTIIAYDELLPSVAFELDKEIISVYAGDRSLKRETQFEPDDQWKNYLIDVNDRTSLQHFKTILSKQSVVIVKNELPAKLDSLLVGRWIHKDFEKWKVYYN
ncbi:MAG: glycosyltransferase family 39 protein [Flammeovirgaceae bacterium]|nr:MAG: glycosyltransferase family 39 protein [Flammeovirgaceae bacterium]